MTFSARKRMHVGLLARLIGRSPIKAGGIWPHTRSRRRGLLDLPAGYEAVDRFILDWLAAEALRGRRNSLPF